MNELVEISIVVVGRTLEALLAIPVSFGVSS
jgi:hypothetical protein